MKHGLNTDKNLAKKIADAICCNPPRPVTRIQLMSGTWPDNEKSEGGLCRKALEECIEKVLSENPCSIRVSSVAKEKV